MNMKSIIKCGLLLLGIGAATVSCEDMFKAENTLVTTNLTPQDTLFHAMGILKKMQKLADRTVLLGEVRADLVTVDESHAPVAIQELGNNEVSSTNIYNQPADYYAVINSCNIYLANVDQDRKSQGTRGFFEKEILAVKCYRAWCYLELIKIYGEVPFLTTPVLTSDDAESIVASGQKAGAMEILNYLIDDLMGYPFSQHLNENNDWRSAYGTQTFANIRFNEMVIPIRALLAELYLWRASYQGEGDAAQQDYVNAIRMYHDYFNFPKEEINTGRSTAEWRSRDEETPGDATSYWSNFNDEDECAGVLPVDTSIYHGTVTELRAVFNSLLCNNYYPAVTPSDRLKSLSKSQDYCQLLNEADRVVLYYREHGENYYSQYKTMEGDLRLYSITDGRNNVWSNSEEHRNNSSYNDVRYYNRKYGNDNRAVRHLPFIPFYRNKILYLHMAEALNRAGFTETAFAILKYGLSYYTLTNRNLISQQEFDKLCEIKSLGFTTTEPKYSYLSEADKQDEQKVEEKKKLAEKTMGSFVVWSSEVFGTYTLMKEGATYNRSIEENSTRALQRGIHSFGSGDTEYNEKYYLDDEETRAQAPSYDTIQYVQLRDVGIQPVWDRAAQRKYKNNHDLFLVDSLKWAEDYEFNIWAQEENARKPEVVAQQIEEYYNNDEIHAKRKVHVAKLILDEEALEGAFEGLRFYDLMRFQMQEGVSITPGSIISMPAFMSENPEKYGSTPSGMVGKPWFLTLPSR